MEDKRQRLVDDLNKFIAKFGSLAKLSIRDKNLHERAHMQAVEEDKATDELIRSLGFHYDPNKDSYTDRIEQSNIEAANRIKSGLDEFIAEHGSLEKLKKLNPALYKFIYHQACKQPGVTGSALIKSFGYTPPAEEKKKKHKNTATIKREVLSAEHAGNIEKLGDEKRIVINIDKTKTATDLEKH